MATGDWVGEDANVLDDLNAIEKTLCGEWKLTKNEKMDDYLKLIGIGYVFRKLAGAASCTMLISREGDKIRIITKGPKTTNIFFSLNQEVDVTDPLDNTLRATVKWRYGNLLTDSRPIGNSKAKPTEILREVVTIDGKEQLIMTVTCGSVVMKRYFDRVR